MTDAPEIAAQSPAELALRRLERLQEFLLSDPGNTALRADAFRTALQCSQWESGLKLLRSAYRENPDDPAWILRECDYWLAQKRYPEAREVLARLEQIAPKHPGLAPVVAYNQAYIEFSEGDFAACVARLRPLVSPPAGDALSQQLWLRALHRTGELKEACQWTADAEQAQRLDGSAAGIAALAAIDAGDFAAARRWTALARASGGAPVSMELLVAESSIALASSDARMARQLASEALALNPKDGRTWSARAFGALLAGELDVADQEFRQAVALMPGHIGTWQGLGWTNVLRRDLAAAQAAFESGLALDRNFGESHGAMAVVLAMQGKAQEARDAIERAKRLDKGSLSIRYAEALLSGEAADVEAMRRLATRVLGTKEAPLGGTMADWLPPRN